jgi:hypothetical protein
VLTPCFAAMRAPSRRRKGWLPALLACGLALLAVGRAAVSVKERGALLALFEATGGDGWISSDGWGVAADECTWFGVVCSTASSPPVVRSVPQH